MVHVNAWIYGFDRAVDSAVLHVTADDVVAQLERDDLLVGEYVLDDNDRTVSLLVGILVKLFFLAGFSEL